MAYIVRLTSIDGRTSYLNQDMWASSKNDATRHDTKQSAEIIGFHFLECDDKVKTWQVEEV